jgi:uracil-DNA glycosylase
VRFDPQTFSQRLRVQAAALSAHWRNLTFEFIDSVEGSRLLSFVDGRIAEGAVILPPNPLHALAVTSLDSVRVVILGQDPYHGAGQAHGLAFSVLAGVPPPPSLRNIFGELKADLDLAPPPCGDLTAWARQGVLLLNTVLTVEEGRPASHARKGWEAFTDRLIATIAQAPAPKVFLLWGAHAQAKASMIEAAGPQHLILRANHPSPLSARRPPLPFLGCRHFSCANAFLVAQGCAPIDWRPGPEAPSS